MSGVSPLKARSTVAPETPARAASARSDDTQETKSARAGAVWVSAAAAAKHDRLMRFMAPSIPRFVGVRRVEAAPHRRSAAGPMRSPTASTPALSPSEPNLPVLRVLPPVISLIWSNYLPVTLLLERASVFHSSHCKQKPFRDETGRKDALSPSLFSPCYQVSRNGTAPWRHWR